MKRIKVLQIVSGLNAGGVEAVLKSWWDQCWAENIEFGFASFLPNGEAGDFFRSRGCKIRQLVPIRETSFRNYKRQFADLLYQDDYDIVHSHILLASAYALKAARKARVPNRFMHAHGVSFEQGFRGIPKCVASMGESYLKEQCIRNATLCLACSDKAASYAFGNHDYKIIKNGIKCEKYEYNSVIRERTRSKLGFDEKSFVVGHVGRMSIEKNQLFLLDVFAHVKQIVPTAYLCLIGDGDMRMAIKEKCRELSLEESVVFLGNREDVDQCLQAFDIFAFPSMHEGLGIAVLEAQAAGLPCCVSSEIPRDAIVTDLVRVIDSFSSELWADQILSIRTEKNSCRNRYSGLVKQAGYDEYDSASKMVSIYKHAAGTIE